MWFLWCNCTDSSRFIYNNSWKKCLVTVFTHELLTYQKSLTSERCKQVRSLWIQKLKRARKYRTEALSMYYRRYINTETFVIPSAFYFKYFQSAKMINICCYTTFLAKQGPYFPRREFIDLSRAQRAYRVDSTAREKLEFAIFSVLGDSSNLIGLLSRTTLYLLR